MSPDMSLSRRLSQATDTAETGAGPAAGAELDQLRRRIHDTLINELGQVLHDDAVSEEDLWRRVHVEIQNALGSESVPLSASDRARLVEDMADDIVGYGPIDRLLRDETVTEIMVNGPKMVYVERSGKLELDQAKFLDETHLRRIIDKIVARVGRRIDDSQPMVDARLPDGSRVNAIIHPLAIGGPFLTIRKFSEDPLTVQDLINFGSLTTGSARFLQACVVGKLNMIVSGGTGTGKTTMLNVLSAFIPTDERIITVEDSKELQLGQDHVLSLETRPSNIEGKGEVAIRDLVRNTLRMRPDRIVVGECRAGEALDMLQAMNTGHDGSVTTVHSNSPRDTLRRIETMTMMAGFDLPVTVIREQMASGIDAIVHISRLRDGSRRVTHITEVQGMEGDVVTLQDVFLLDQSKGLDENGKVQALLRPTGIRPKFSEKLLENGIRLNPAMFDPNGGSAQ
jgi:pilus assembly protein CpaF